MVAYENTRAAIKSNPSMAERVQFEGSSFGARLTATGLRLEHVQCWILPAKFAVVEDDTATAVTSAREVAEAAEWILQRIFLPVLGRQ